MVAIADIDRTATFAWSHHKLPILATGSISGSIDANFSSDSKLEFWSIVDLKKDINNGENVPFHSIESTSKFNDLDWSLDNKIIAGALDDGTVEFYSSPTSSSDYSSSKIIKSLKNHTTSVKTLKFNPSLSNVLISGDSKGLINIWDTNKITNSNYAPTQPGIAISSIDEIKSLSWNKNLSHVFACAGSSSGFASIWDLKAKKELMHLSYTSPLTNNKIPLDIVEWHPTNSTRIATASSSDLDPSVLIWDLRQPNSPITTLSGAHSKGILSLDWCSQDSDLLISSGSDNTVVLSDPDTLQKNLTIYPARSNWLFKTKFSPAIPDLFASSGYDNKIQIQTLQDIPTQFDELTKDEIKNESEDDFWNTVGNSKTNKQINLEKPTVVEKFCPKWLKQQKSPCAQWAFGGKLVSIGSDGKSIHINKPETIEKSSTNNEMLNNALKTKDFNPIINRRLNNSINPINEEDWTFLEKLSMDGKKIFLKELMSFDDETSDEEDNDDDNEGVDGLSKKKQQDKDGKDFFENFEKEVFDPATCENQSFKLDISTNDLIKSLSNHELSKSVDFTLENADKHLLESFIIALISKDQKLIAKVVDKYFVKFGPKSALSRYLFSLYSKQFEDIVDNCDVTQWKFVAKTIQNYESNQELQYKLLTKLGDKVLEDGNRQDALILYMASNNIGKISEIWLKEFNELEVDFKNKMGKKTTNYEAHLECLTEFVERFSCFSNSFNDGSKMQLDNDELISRFLEFVNMISSNGDFDLALHFLEALPGKNEDVNTEKHRVLIASGKAVTASSASATATAGSRARKSVVSTTAGSRANLLHSATTGKSTFIPAHPVPTNVNSSNAMAQGSSPFVPLPHQPFQPTSTYAPAVQTQVQTPSPYNPMAGASNTPTTVANPYAPTRAANAGVPQNANPYGPPASSFKPQMDKTLPPPPTATSSSFTAAPVPVTPAVVNSYQPPVANVIPTGTPFSNNNNNNNNNNTPYSPPLSSQQQQMNIYNSGVVPPVANGPISGQTPGLNKKANQGWNDLDLPVKDSIVRAKAVITKPIPGLANSASDYGHGNASIATPLASAGISLPPPPTGSRVSSQPSPMDLPPLKRVTSEATTKYAPPVSTIASAPTSNGFASLNSPIPSILSPYAPPPVAAASSTSGFSNPYATPPVNGHPLHSNKFVPPTGGVFPPTQPRVNAAHPPFGSPAANVPQAVAPPPMSRKSHVTPSDKVENVIASLDAIKESTPVPNGIPDVQHPQPVVATSPQTITEQQPEQTINTLSSEVEGIIEYFKEELKRVAPLVPQEYHKQLKDSNKRLKFLFQHLENQELVSSVVIGKIGEIIECMKSGKYFEAKNIQVDIATNHADEAGNWLTGVKRLISIAEATGVSSA